MIATSKLQITSCPHCADSCWNVPHVFVLSDDQSEFVVAASAWCLECNKEYKAHEHIKNEWAHATTPITAP